MPLYFGSTLISNIGVINDTESGGDANHSDYINPEWTDWSYFNFMNSRNSLVHKIKTNDTANGTNFEAMFEKDTTLTNDNLPELNVSKAINLSCIFRGCTGLTSVPEWMQGDNTKNNQNFRRTFRGCSNITTFSDENGNPLFNTESGNSFEDFLRECASITEIPKFDTSNGESFDAAFMDCENIKRIPAIDTSSGKLFQYMFYGCKGLEDIDEGEEPITLNTNKGTNFNYMFSVCDFTEIPVNLSSTANGESFDYFLEYSRNIEKVPYLDTSKGKEFICMFHECGKDSKNPIEMTKENAFDLSSALDCYGMFFDSNFKNIYLKVTEPDCNNYSTYRETYIPFIRNAPKMF